MIPKTYNDLVPKVKERPIDKSIEYYWELKEDLKKDPKSEELQKKLTCQKAIIEVTCEHFGYWEKLLYFSELDSTLESLAFKNIDMQKEVDMINNELIFKLANETKQFLNNIYNFN